MKAVITVIGLVAFLVLSGCAKHTDAPPPRSLARAKDPGKVLNLLLSKQNEVTFVSRAGKMYGMDSDTVLTFLPGRKVRLTEYGYSVAVFEGVFTTETEGSISLQLEKRRSPWPLMVLQFAEGEYYLHTKAGASEFVMGDRAGATESTDMKPFWPFKLVAERKPEPDQPLHGTPAEAPSSLTESEGRSP